jgi:soluble P-type ATPase
MFTLDIPGFGPVQLKYLVSDFTGTLSVDGRLLEGVRDRLNEIGGFLEIHFLTADTFGKAQEELKDIRGSRIQILTGQDHDRQKEEYVRRLGAEQTIAFGNGNNDRLMLKAAKIGVAVSTGEGCAADAIRAADIFVTHILEGLDLLLHPKRLKATLRF